MHNLEKLSPFKYYIITSFPYIEEDFDALTNYELFCKVTKYLNDILDSQNDVIDNFNEVYAAWLETKEYIDNFFETLDVQSEINYKLDQMALDGSLANLINPLLPTVVAAWLSSHITPTTPVVDNTLSVSGAAADAKVTGDLKWGYRGTMSGLQYTAFTSCNASGFYRFATSDIANITDVPVGVVSGGLLFNYPYSGTVSYQVLLSGEGEWFRYYSPVTVGSWKRIPITDATLTIAGAAADSKATGDNTFMYRGTFTELQYSTTRDCKKIGFYHFSTAELANIADMPADITVGGMIAVFPNTATSRFQLLISQNKQYFRYDADNSYAAWARMPITDRTLSIQGMAADAKAVNDKVVVNRYNIISNNNITDLNNCIETGIYQWYTADIANLTNLPENTTTGGVLIVNNFGGDSVIWQMAYTGNRIDVRYPNTGEWHTIYNRYDHRLPAMRWQIMSTPGNDNSTEQITVYYYKQDAANQVNDDRVTLVLGRCLNTSLNSDVWRLMYAYKYINDTNTRLNRQSEWECALSVDGSGYIGGYIHGGETNPTIRVFLDGQEKTQANLANAVSFKSLKIVMTSDIYSGSTKIAEHGKEYIFDESHKIILRQSLKWVTGCTVNNCFLQMLPPLKSIFTNYITNSDIAVKNLSDLGSDYNVPVPEMSIADIFANTGVHIIGGVGSYWHDTDKIPFISDHDSEYHKFYFPAANNTTVSAGDVWKSESFIEVI